MGETGERKSEAGTGRIGTLFDQPAVQVRSAKQEPPTLYRTDDVFVLLYEGHTSTAVSVVR